MKTRAWLPEWLNRALTVETIQLMFADGSSSERRVGKWDAKDGRLCAEFKFKKTRTVVAVSVRVPRVFEGEHVIVCPARTVYGGDTYEARWRMNIEWRHGDDVPLPQASKEYRV